MLLFQYICYCRCIVYLLSTGCLLYMLLNLFFVSYPQDTLVSIFTDLKYLLFHYTLPIITGAFIFISVMFMLRYRNEKQNHEKLMKEKTELELHALKSRLNPHFCSIP